MHTHSAPLNRGRLALLAVVVGIVAMLVALPATALARTTTRIVVAKTMTIHNDTPGTTPWPVALAAKLQKRVSGTHYHALSGAVKLYQYNSDTAKYDLKGSIKSSSPTFSLHSSLQTPGRGKYKLVYSGSSTMKPCTAYTTVYETIGDTVSAPTILIDPIAGTTQSWVTVKYDLGWNTEAWDGPVVLDYTGEFESVDADNVMTEYNVWVDLNREVWNPGTVEFNYKFDSTDLLSVYENAAPLDRLWTEGGAYVDTSLAPYIVTPSDVVFVHQLNK